MWKKKINVPARVDWSHGERLELLWLSNHHQCDVWFFIIISTILSVLTFSKSNLKLHFSLLSIRSQSKDI